MYTSSQCARLEPPMVRTQIYLTAREKAALEAMARRTGKTQSELIREAIDAMLANPALEHRRGLLAAGRGLWESRTDLPDFGAVRRELDRATVER